MQSCSSTFDTSSQSFQRQDDQEVDAHLFMFLSSAKQTKCTRILKVIKAMCTFEVHLCMMYGQLILLGKPFNTFSMARLKILQLRLTLTPLFTTTNDPTI
jgi:hypothetical protein